MPIDLRRGDTFTIHSHQISFPTIISDLRKGQEVLTNDGQLKLEIVKVTNNSINLLAKCDGRFENNKGFHVVGSAYYKKLPLLQPRDMAFINFAIKNNITYVGISYLRNVDEVHQIYDLLKKSNTKPIFKIETREALNSLDIILPDVKKAILDRGDLSGEIGIYNILAAQEKILEGCDKYNVDLYVATQILFNMVNNAFPLIPEILELSRLMRRKIAGIQFSDECAIGVDPMKCVDTFRELEELLQTDKKIIN